MWRCKTHCFQLFLSILLCVWLSTQVIWLLFNWQKKHKYSATLDLFIHLFFFSPLAVMGLCVGESVYGQWKHACRAGKSSVCRGFYSPRGLHTDDLILHRHTHSHTNMRSRFTNMKIPLSNTSPLTWSPSHFYSAYLPRSILPLVSVSPYLAAPWYQLRAFSFVLVLLSLPPPLSFFPLFLQQHLHFHGDLSFTSANAHLSNIFH